MPKSLTLIVACGENRVIGRDGRLPFAIPEDQAWFHEKTAGTTVLLGRICYETWPRVLADGRQPVVVTADPARAYRHAASLRRVHADSAPEVPVADRVRVAAGVPAALALAQTLPGEIMICGGQRIYEETLARADRLLLTLVHADIAGDTWFPEWRQLNWREVSRREGRDAGYRYTFFTLERQA